MKYLRTLAILSIIIFIDANLFAQGNKATSQKVAVKIINGSKRGVAMMSTYFNAIISKKILTQISPASFMLVKKYCNESSYPACILAILEYNPAKPDENASETMLTSLKLYQIAMFDNIQNGENFGKSSILVAPAKENKNVGGNCNYNKDFYIIIQSNAIEILK